MTRQKSPTLEPKGGSLNNAETDSKLRVSVISKSRPMGSTTLQKGPRGFHINDISRAQNSNDHHKAEYVTIEWPHTFLSRVYPDGNAIPKKCTWFSAV